MMNKEEVLFQSIEEIVDVKNLSICLQKLFPNMKIIDFLFHVPLRLVDRSPVKDVSRSNIGDDVTVVVQVLRHQKIFGKKTFHKVVCKAHNNNFHLLFFNGNSNFIEKMLKIGCIYAVSGKITNSFVICHPDKIVPFAQFNADSKLDVIYPLTQGVTQNIMKNIIRKALNYLPDLDEWIDSSLMTQKQWMSWGNSIREIHNPTDLKTYSLARMRLAYDELLAHQLQLYRCRSKVVQSTGRSFIGDLSLRNLAINNLGFKLTSAQKYIISEINAKQSEKKKMMAVLQGDVGSGKTVVALFAILNVIECKMQAAIMVPTSILANQHANWIKKVLPNLNVEVLTTHVKKSVKKRVIEGLRNGMVDLLIGTHALIEEDIEFKNLALVVIDEQHRFGVSQRLKLIDKSNNADILLISATPIPRTMMHIIYGDIECFKLSDKPEGRLPIITSIFNKKNIMQIINSLKNIVNKSAKIYWICPLIEESDSTIDVASVEERYQFLDKSFPNKVGMINGKMKKNEIDAKMAEFKEGKIVFLVATTVIEVGIDVNDANVIVIENAEKFGLAQLHQLRGRVGRSNIQSYCILLYSNLSKTSYLRLRVIKDSQDGFYIADQDLKIRGYGDLIGKQQSGMQNFIFANLYEDYDLMYATSLIAKNIASSGCYSKYSNVIRIFAEKKSNCSEESLPFS